jgi:hypothetical protein
LPDGRLRLSLETPWSDGTEAIALSPMDLIARLCALLSPPRMHLTRFFGVLSSASKHRAEVVPTPEPDPELQPLVQLSLLEPDAAAPALPRRSAASFVLSARSGAAGEQGVVMDAAHGTLSSGSPVRTPMPQPLIVPFGQFAPREATATTDSRSR